MNEKIDKDFIDINEENPHKKYIIVGILYIIVIILTILLILGLKNQKDTVEVNINNETSINQTRR